MKEVDFKKILDNHFNNKITEFEIYYILRTEDDEGYSYSAFYCNMPGLKSDLQKDYRQRAYDVLKGKVSEEYDLIASQAESIEIIDSKKVSNLKKIKILLNKVVAKKASEVDVRLSDIWGYVITFVNEKKKKLCMYRKFTLPKAFNARRKVSIVNGNLQEIKDDIFTIDMNIDAFELNGNTYIVNRYYFETFFSFKEEYVKYVEDSLNHLKNENVIDNFDEFSLRCLESNNLVRKLVYVVKQNRLKWLKINISGAKSVIGEYNLKVVIDSGRIVYSKKDCNITDVMKLICGCCVKDAVDMHKYFATSVKEVS